MKAAYINQPGPPESIVYGERPTPAPTGSQVLVKVAAVAVNPIDTYIRSGAVAMTLPQPFVVGCDLAGVVETPGPKAKRFQPGDRVWCSCQGILGRQGTFAEYAAVDESFLNPIPEGVSDETAAACALVSLTAHLGVVRDAGLKAGETLFVNGGTGGVGSMVVQIAKAIGARVVTTAGSDEKLAKARSFGADLAINYKTEDVPARVKEFAPDGINVWWETLREPDFDRTVSLLAPRGRMILMAGRDARPPFPVGPFYVKGCRLYGFAMFNATTDELRSAAADDVNRWLACRPNQTLHRPRAAARGDRNRASAAGRKHGGPEWHACGEDCAQTLNDCEMIERILEPEWMDTAEDVREYDAMDHAAVNAAFVTDLMGALSDWSLQRPVQSEDAPQLKILDLGAGTAQIPIEICRRLPGVRVVAVDAAASMLAVARENIAAAGFAERIELMLANAKRLPFPDASLAVVMSNSIVHHIAEPVSVLAEAVRVALPGGLQFHRDLCRPADEAELTRLVETYVGDATPYQRKLFSDSLHAALTLEEIRSLVAGLGFERESVRMTSDRHWTWLATSINH